MTYSVLAIAPAVTGLPALSTAAELARIGDLPGVQLAQLTGPVTKQRIIDRLAAATTSWTSRLIDITLAYAMLGEITAQRGRDV